MQVATPKYAGMIDAFRSIVRQEGPRVLFAGLGPPMITMTLTNAVAFSTYSFFNGLLARLSGLSGTFGDADLQRTRPAWHFFVAGGLTAFSCTPITTPSELVKVRMQLDKERRFANSWQCARAVWAEHRLRGLYRGYLINGIRETVFVSVYFGCYEVAKRNISQAVEAAVDSHDGDDLAGLAGRGYASLAIPVAGGLAGAGAWVASFPLDTIKTVIQGADLREPGTLKRIWQIGSGQLRRQGLGSFYRGVVPSVTRAFIVSSTRFSAFEWAFNLVRRLEGLDAITAA